MAADDLPLAGCRILLLRSGAELGDELTLRATVAQHGGQLSVNGVPALEARALTHVVAASWAAVVARAPSLAHRYQPVRPDAPLLAESGVPAFVSHQWLGHALQGAGRRPREADFAVPTVKWSPPAVDGLVCPGPPVAKKVRRHPASQQWACAVCTLAGNVGLACTACGGARDARGSGTNASAATKHAIVLLSTSDSDDDAPLSDQAAASVGAVASAASEQVIDLLASDGGDDEPLLDEVAAIDSDACLAAQLARDEMDAASLALAQRLQSEEAARALAGTAGAGRRQHHYQQHQQHRRPRTPPPPPGPRRIFSGASFYLNKLRHRGSRDVRQPVGEARPPEIDPHEIIWDASKLEAAIFTSYGTDYEHLLTQLGAMRDKSKVIVCDMYDHTRERAQVHLPTNRQSLDGPESRANEHFIVVHPCMDTTAAGSGTASARSRMRGERGTMHPKLMLLLFPDFLRISISSANIGAYESQINQQYWIHDIPRQAQNGHQAVRSQPHSSGYHSFQVELLDFVQKILTVNPNKPLIDKRNSLPLFDAWGSLLKGPELRWNVPSGVHLVASIPGVYTSEADLHRYGHMRIRALLAEHLAPLREDSIVPKRVEVQCSSLGQLRADFLRSFIKSVSTDSGFTERRSNEDKPVIDSVRKQMEQLRDGTGGRLILDLSAYQRRQCHAIAEELGLEHDSLGHGTSRRLHIFLSPHEGLMSFANSGSSAIQKNEHHDVASAAYSPAATPIASPPAYRHTQDGTQTTDLRLVWPTFDTVARCVLSVGSSETRSSPGQLQERAENAAGMTAADDWKEQWYPRQIFCDHLPPWPHRQFTLHHSKVIALTVDDDGTGDAVPPEEEHHALCRWVYVGSHNFSTVAWGVSEGARCFRVCSWELGVMIIPARPKRFPLPFTANSKRYRFESSSAPPDRPWGTGAVRERLHGSGEAELAARQNVSRCIRHFEDIVAVGSTAATRPTILRQTFGELVEPRQTESDGATRICLFLDLHSNGNHDDAVRSLWAPMAQLGDLVDTLFKGVWIGGVDGTMGHSELVCRDMGYSGRTSELPCLRVFASHHTLLEVDGPEAISRICTGPGGVSNLAKQLREAAERSALVAVIGRADKQRRQKEQYDRHTMHLRNAHFIRKRYKCIVFDCEGVLKKPINKTLQRGHKFDSWCSASRGCKDCVPFMSQLLLPRDVVDQLGLCPAQSPTSTAVSVPTGSSATEDKESEEKELLTPVGRRDDAPQLCVVSNVGVAQTEILDDGHLSPLRHDGSAQTIISATLIRLAAELHMLPEFDPTRPAFSAAQDTQPLLTSGEDLVSTAEARLGIAARFVSYVRDVRADEAKRVRTQHWTTVEQEGLDGFDPANAKPRGGGVLIALKRAGIAPNEALMITSPLPEDREAAIAAGVDWMDAAYLFSGKVPAEENIQANRRHGPASGVQSFGDHDALDVNRKRDGGANSGTA